MQIENVNHVLKSGDSKYHFAFHGMEWKTTLLTPSLPLSQRLWMFQLTGLISNIILT